MKFNPAASWRRRTCPGAGSPTWTSSHLRTSGPPVSWTRIACGIRGLQRRWRTKEKPRRDGSRRGSPFERSTKSNGRVGRKRCEQKQRDDVGDLDHRVHGGTRGVLVGIAARVAGHRGLVGLGAFAAIIAVLDVLLGIVPSAAA